jgi:hypothetical protein
MALPYCNTIIANYCDSQKPDIDAACHEESKEAGKHIMFQPIPGKKSTCWCVCSCLGSGTAITLGDGSTKPVSELKPGTTQVLAAGRGLVFTPMTVNQVSAAAPGETENTILLRYRVGGASHDLVLTMDHPLFVQNRRGERLIVAAGNLQADDQLLDRAGALVSIDTIHWGSYPQFWELATHMDPPNADLDGHLVLTEGIVTGDFAVAAFVDYPLGLGRTTAQTDPDRPDVGSPQWRRRYDYVETDAPIMVHGQAFLPAETKRVAVPAYASAFLPSRQAAELEAPEVPKRPLGDQYYLEECQWLVAKVFRPLYPDVTFLFDWYSDTVNSFSWVEVDSEQKYVYLSGGLSRIEGFDYEGVALALAHEIGHLYGKPVVRDGVTCEGEADFYGALNVLRKAWFGEYYFEFTSRAVDQLKKLYEYLGSPPEPLTDASGDPYPSNDCRVETVETAMRSPRIPSCAKCVVPPDDPGKTA